MAQLDRDARRRRLRRQILLSLFAALIFLLTFTPLGFIQLVFIKATVIHIPVILGSLLLGPLAGAVLGASFGLASFISNTLQPSLLSFCFSPLIPLPGLDHGHIAALLICFLPRIILGILPSVIYRPLARILDKRKHGAAGIPPVSGLVALVTTFLHTVMVMGLIYLLFTVQIAELKAVSLDKVPAYVLSVVVVNGVPEAIAAALVTALAYLPISRALAKHDIG